MSKKVKATPIPPTVLVITLESDGNASLLARRGEFAHLSQFTYRGLPEIIEAIQYGASELIVVEQNPPVIDIATTEVQIIEPVVNPDVEQLTGEAADIDDEPVITPINVEDMPDPSPNPQPKLL